jgi:UDP-N-acetylmuramate--alanine ligase
VPFYGAVVLCLDDGPVQDILPRIERRIVSYGLSPQAHVSARDVEVAARSSRFMVTAGGEELGPVSLSVPGTHNVANALAAIAVGLDLGIPFESVRSGLEAFSGVDRRFQIRGEADGVVVVDDYGHHPTEIRATLEALRRFAGSRRTVILFQPHRFTRTQALWDDFCRAFHNADLVLLADIYPASEAAIPGITAEALAAAILERGHRHVSYAGSVEAAGAALIREVQPGDVVLTLGAGNVWTAGEALLRARRQGS